MLQNAAKPGVFQCDPVATTSTFSLKASKPPSILNAPKLGSAQRDPVATTLTFFSLKGPKPPPTLKLLLKDWYLSTEHRAEDKWYLYWEKDRLRFQDSGGQFIPAFSFHFDEIDSSEVCLQNFCIDHIFEL